MRRLAEAPLLVASAVLSLIALALMAWSVLVPKPLPVVLFMTLGQAIGTVSFLLYILAILIDLRRARVLARR